METGLKKENPVCTMRTKQEDVIDMPHAMQGLGYTCCISSYHKTALPRAEAEG